MISVKPEPSTDCSKARRYKRLPPGWQWVAACTEGLRLWQARLATLKGRRLPSRERCATSKAWRLHHDATRAGASVRRRRPAPSAHFNKIPPRPRAGRRRGAGRRAEAAHNSDRQPQSRTSPGPWRVPAYSQGSGGGWWWCWRWRQRQRCGGRVTVVGLRQLLPSPARPGGAVDGGTLGFKLPFSHLPAESRGGGASR